MGLYATRHGYKSTECLDWVSITCQSHASAHGLVKHTAFTQSFPKQLTGGCFLEKHLTVLMDYADIFSLHTCKQAAFDVMKWRKQEIMFTSLLLQFCLHVVLKKAKYNYSESMVSYYLEGPI